MFGNWPFLYPMYGLGDIPKAFSKLWIASGWLWMLNTPVDEIIFDSSGKVKGVRSGSRVAKAPLVICDPSYAKNLEEEIKCTGKVIRSIWILNHPVLNTQDAASCQIILPYKQK